MHLGLILLAAALPGFEQFQQADLQRRDGGQWETTETAALVRVDPARVLAIAAKSPSDPLIQWGAAELLGDWTNRHARFEAALAGSGTNTAIAVRYAAAAAAQGQRELAVNLARLCQANDPSNAVPWVVEAWLQPPPADNAQPLTPPLPATVFADGAALAARARIKLLEQIGYSPYAARRIGYNVDQLVLPLLRQLDPQRVGLAWLRQLAVAMQQKPTFLVTELVGQSLENRLGATAERVADLKDRREQLIELTQSVGRHVLPLAREAELVRYYDEMLALGEEQALQRLKHTVETGRQPR